MAELTGKAISELPAATTINDTDLLALSQNGASKKITPPVLLSLVEGKISGLSGSLATYVRPNLLDNWYFAGNGSQNGNFPINQRGQEYYTNAGVTIDRWFKGTNGAINSITKAYGLLITPNTVLYQKLSTDTKDALDGKTCTLTLLTNDGKIRSGTFVYKSAPSSTITILNVAGVVKFECGIDGNIYITWLSSFNTGYFAIKLELGDTQTLAHQENGVWVLNEIPNFADELARCKRYYNKFPVETYLSGVYRPVEGAIRLTINESVNQNVSLGMSEFYVLTEAGGIQGSYVPTSIARTYWSPTAFTVDITSSFTSAAWTPVTLAIVNGTINADL